MSACRLLQRSEGARKRFRVVVVLIVLAMAAASCGGSDSDGDDAATATAAPEGDEASTATAAPESDEASSATAAPDGDEASTATVAPDSEEASTTTGAAPEDNGDASASSGNGECTLEISGDHQASFVFEQDPTSVSTDYWLSEDALRDIVDQQGEFAGGSYEELVASGEPILSLLQLSCGLNLTTTGTGGLIVASQATRTSDLAMGPGSYPISGGLFDDASPAGTMGASVTLEDEPYETVPGSGSVEITQWDSQVVAGSFSFTAQELFEDDPKEIAVTVSFSFLCARAVGTRC